MELHSFAWQMSHLDVVFHLHIWRTSRVVGFQHMAIGMSVGDVYAELEIIAFVLSHQRTYSNGSWNESGILKGSSKTNGMFIDELGFASRSSYDMLYIESRVIFRTIIQMTPTPIRYPAYKMRWMKSSPSWCQILTRCWIEERRSIFSLIKRQI